MSFPLHYLGYQTCKDTNQLDLPTHPGLRSNYANLIMFPYWTIYTACRMSVCTLLLIPLSTPLSPTTFPLVLPLSSSLSLHVGSSLRLHFSCLGSALSSPANKSSANLLPESLCPCSDCSSPPLPGNTAGEGGAERAREAEEGREGGREEEEREGRLKKKKRKKRYQIASSAVLKQQASLCQKVFQRAGSFPCFPPALPLLLAARPTVHYCEG